MSALMMNASLHLGAGVASRTSTMQRGSSAVCAPTRRASPVTRGATLRVRAEGKYMNRVRSIHSAVVRRAPFFCPSPLVFSLAVRRARSTSQTTWPREDSGEKKKPIFLSHAHA